MRWAVVGASAPGCGARAPGSDKLSPTSCQSQASRSHSSLSVVTEVPWAWSPQDIVLHPSTLPIIPGRCLHLPTERFLFEASGLRHIRLKRSLCPGENAVNPKLSF